MLRENEDKTILISNTAIVGKNVKIGHNVCILGDSVIEDNVEISSNTVIENSKIGDGTIILSSFVNDSEIESNSSIGPFAHIRGNSKIGKNCRVGNFVEVKNAIVGDGSKMAHLAYIGDTEIGKNCNIGCGVVFCNYNGKIKQKSYLGDNVFVGSNANIIAPVTISDNAYIAAGSTINKDVGKGDLAIARVRQENKKNFKNPYLDR